MISVPFLMTLVIINKVSIRFLQYKIIPFPFVINKYLIGRDFLTV